MVRVVMSSVCHSQLNSHCRDTILPLGRSPARCPKRIVGAVKLHLTGRRRCRGLRHTSHRPWRNGAKGTSMQCYAFCEITGKHPPVRFTSNNDQAVFLKSCRHVLARFLFFFFQCICLLTPAAKLEISNDFQC